MSDKRKSAGKKAAATRKHSKAARKAAATRKHRAPEFRVRGEGVSNDGARWVHIGTHETYIALGQSRVEPAMGWTPYQGLPGVNHLAYEVDDVEALRNRMTSAGYRDSTPPNAHPHRKRMYFCDPEGNDW